MHASKSILHELHRVRETQRKTSGKKMPKKTYEDTRCTIKGVFEQEGREAKLAWIKQARASLPGSYKSVATLLVRLADKIDHFPLGIKSGKSLLDANKLEGFWSRLWMYNAKVGHKTLKSFMGDVGRNIVDWLLFNARVQPVDKRTLVTATCRFFGLELEEYASSLAPPE